ncbi:MAG TPA: SRPBCC domain-containing protein [Puia sp.]|nr:SRPBCC domain-containing protein [Puia sp.]
MSQNEAFVMERVYDAAVEKVWKALTDKEAMKKWYFDIAEFKPVVGFEFQFTGENEGRIFLHICKIEEVVINKKLKYSWRYDGYPGKSFVAFELFDEKGKTRLRLTHEGLETFPDVPDFARKNFEAGWTYIIGKSLPEYLGK